MRAGARRCRVDGEVHSAMTAAHRLRAAALSMAPSLMVMDVFPDCTARSNLDLQRDRGCAIRCTIDEERCAAEEV
jgi:hypothetical protein